VGLLQRAGLLPSFNECAVCGGEIVPPASFSAGLGGAVCFKCGQAKGSGDHQANEIGSNASRSDVVQGTPVSLGALKTLEMLRDAGNQCPNLTAKGQVRQEVNGVLEQCVEHALGKRLKSSLLVGSILVGPHRE